MSIHGTEFLLIAQHLHCTLLELVIVGRGYFSNHVHPKTAVLACLAQPYNDLGRLLVNRSHESDLMGALLHICLVNIESIYLQCTRPRPMSEL